MANNLTISGVVTHVLQEVSGVSKSGNTWRSKTIVITTIGDYPKQIAFELRGENIDKFAPIITIGCSLTADVRIDAFEYNGKWFNRISTTRVSVIV